jgi:hypothetical protein
MGKALEGTKLLIVLYTHRYEVIGISFDENIKNVDFISRAKEEI